MTISPKTIERVSEAILDAFDLTGELPLLRWYDEEEMRHIAIAAIKAARHRGRRDWRWKPSRKRLAKPPDASTTAERPS